VRFSKVTSLNLDYIALKVMGRIKKIMLIPATKSTNKEIGKNLSKSLHPHIIF